MGQTKRNPPRKHKMKKSTSVKKKILNKVEKKAPAVETTEERKMKTIGGGSFSMKITILSQKVS